MEIDTRGFRLDRTKNIIYIGEREGAGFNRPPTKVKVFS